MQAKLGYTPLTMLDATIRIYAWFDYFKCQPYINKIVSSDNIAIAIKEIKVIIIILIFIKL